MRAGCMLHVQHHGQRHHHSQLPCSKVMKHEGRLKRETLLRPTMALAGIFTDDSPSEHLSTVRIAQTYGVFTGMYRRTINDLALTVAGTYAFGGPIGPLALDATFDALSRICKQDTRKQKDKNLAAFLTEHDIDARDTYEAIVKFIIETCVC